MDSYDVAVIGGGPGGYVCAIRCAQQGLKTILIEKEHLGGTCLNWGCIPTKSLLQSAKVYSLALKTKEFGINCKDIEIDFDAIMKRKDDVVTKLRYGIEGIVKGNGCTILAGTAKFIDRNTIEVETNEGNADNEKNNSYTNDKKVKACKSINNSIADPIFNTAVKNTSAKQIKFKNAVIATGSTPSKIAFEGLETINWVDSDGFLSMDKLPKSALIIGTGVIGLEFCTFLNTLGVRVIMVDILPEITGDVDAEIAKTLRTIMEKRGVTFHLNAKIEKFERQNESNICYFSKTGTSQKESSELIIMATGRKANTAGLQFEAAGVKSERGFICVDDYCATNIPNIFAIGDVNGRAMLAHAASAQGMVVADNLINTKMKKAEFVLIPSCIYTEPEIATIGLNEKKAKLKGMGAVVGKFNVSGNGKSLIIGENQGFAKIVADKQTGEILGLQLICEHATEMIGEGLLAMKLESTLEEISDAIHPHPTVNEIIMEAAHDALGHCAHKIIPKNSG